MNLYKARELHSKKGVGLGIWHYTRYNDNQKNTRAIGYCSKWKKPKLIEDGGFWTKEEAEKHIANKSKYHNKKGHATAEEACECYKNYLLDTSLKFYKKSLEETNTHHKCAVDGCSKMTASSASINPYSSYYLCEDHLNRKEVEKLFSIGESWGS